MAKTVYKKKIKNNKEYYFFRLRHDNLMKPKDIYATTVKELEAKIKRITYDLDNNIVNNKDCFETFFKNWLFDVHFLHLKPSSKENYESIFRLYIKNSPLSKIMIRDLCLNDIQSYYNKLFSSGCTPMRISNIHKLIKPCIRYAYNNNLILKDFTGAIVLPREKEEERLNKKDKVVPFTLEEQKTFITAVKGHYLEMFFITALNTGLREGELFALTWNDINLKEGYINVNKTYRRISSISKEGRSKADIVIQTPKTKKSIRKVPIPNFLIKLLKQYKKEQSLCKLNLGNKYNNNNLVFSNRYGNYLNESTVRFHYKNILKNNKIPERKIHDMRHTYATRLFELGEDPKTVQELLGHSNVSITLNTYTHVLESVKKKAVSKLDNLSFTMN